MNYKILIAEDEQDIAELLKLYLENEGYCVFGAGNGVEALEIVARVNSNLRRFYQLNTEKPKREESYILKVGDLSLDTQTLVLKKKGEEVLLTPMEYKILALLMKKPGTIYTKVQIYESTSGEYFESDDNTIMVHISNLRDKIEDNPKNPRYIKTIRGVGYKIEDR